MVEMYSTSIILSLILVQARVSQGYAPSTVWADIQIMQEQVQLAKQKFQQNDINIRGTQNHHRSLQLQQVCDAVIDLFDAMAPQNKNRVCDCNFLAQSLTCNYEEVVCKDKILPTLDVTYDLGLGKSTVDICQEFQEEEFDRVCIQAELTNMKYDTCTKATMGEGDFETECSCNVCEGGLTLELDCTANNPLAKTQGCQRVFFEDTCLDFAPTANYNTTDLPFSFNSTTQTSRQFPTPEERNIQNDDDLVSPALPTPQELAVNWTQLDPNPHNTTKYSQRYAMAALYYATTIHGSEWIRDDGWLSYDVDECDWYSNSTKPCSANGELETLKLPDNQLLGSLVPEIGMLTSLKRLELSVNSLSGPLPTTIGSLTNLQEIDMFGTGLYGTIPTELGLLTNLQVRRLT